MKKVIIVLIFIILCSGCTIDTVEKSNDLNEDTIYDKYDVSEWISLTSEDELFRVTVFINKLNFNQEETINLFSTVEYLGDKKEIDTWSGDPNFKYIIFDGIDYYCEDYQNDILMKTKFVKGEVNNYPFKKSGGWNADDPRADFWESYYRNPELQLPVGTYEVTAFCDFSFNDTVPFDEYKQEVKFDITVE